MSTATKRHEIVVAVWANRTGAERFGCRRYPNDLSCDSMWLSLRVVDDDSYSAWRQRNLMSSIGLWVWWSTDIDSICVEFRGHGIHSAQADELEGIAKELRRLNKRVPARLHGQSYTDYVVATIRAVGIKRVVEYRGIGVPDEYHPLTSVVDELRREIEARSVRKAA